MDDGSLEGVAERTRHFGAREVLASDADVFSDAASAALEDAEAT